MKRVFTFLSLPRGIEQFRLDIFSKLQSELLALCDENKFSGMLSHVTSIFGRTPMIANAIEKVRNVLGKENSVTGLVDKIRELLTEDADYSEGSFHERLQKIATAFSPYIPSQPAASCASEG